MKEYVVEVREILSLLVPVTAETREEAIRQVEEMYDNEDIVLTAENFFYKEIEVLDEEDD